MADEKIIDKIVKYLTTNRELFKKYLTDGIEHFYHYDSYMYIERYSPGISDFNAFRARLSADDSDFEELAKLDSFTAFIATFERIVTTENKINEHSYNHDHSFFGASSMNEVMNDVCDLFRAENIALHTEIFKLKKLLDESGYDIKKL